MGTLVRSGSTPSRGKFGLENGLDKDTSGGFGVISKESPWKCFPVGVTRTESLEPDVALGVVDGFNLGNGGTGGGGSEIDSIAE